MQVSKPVQVAESPPLEVPKNPLDVALGDRDWWCWVMVGLEDPHDLFQPQTILFPSAASHFIAPNSLLVLPVGEFSCKWIGKRSGMGRSSCFWGKVEKQQLHKLPELVKSSSSALTPTTTILPWECEAEMLKFQVLCCLFVPDPSLENGADINWEYPNDL